MPSLLRRSHRTLHCRTVAVRVAPGFSTDWFSTRVPVWDDVLARFRGAPDIHFIEIGSWEGMSACWLLLEILTHPSSTLTCIDPFEHEHHSSSLHCDFEGLFDANVTATGAADRVTKIRGTSLSALRRLPLEHYHLVYIDGSHRAPDVLTDAVLAWPLLRPEGILIFDDYEWCYDERPLWQPKAAIDAFTSVFADGLDVIHRGWQVIVQKRSTTRLSQ